MSGELHYSDFKNPYWWKHKKWKKNHLSFASNKDI